MKSILKLLLIIIGTIIGAGFASGKEIYTFFSIYGNKGIIGIIVSSALTGVIIYCVLNIIKKYNIENYDQFLNRLSNKKYINQIINIIINIFLLISFYIMIAGFCAYFNQQFSIPYIISSIIIAILCYIVFKNNINGIIKSNEILIPILIVIVVIIGLKSISTSPINNYEGDIILIPKYNWLISSILYASYNSILLVPILSGLKKYIHSKKQIILTSILCAGTMLVLGEILFIILKQQSNLTQIELPLMYIVSEFGKVYTYLYSFVIVAAIFTSVISAGYGILQNYNNEKTKYKLISVIMCVTSIFVAKLGFSNLVTLLYPIFGLLGILQIILIVAKNKIH